MSTIDINDFAVVRLTVAGQETYRKHVQEAGMEPVACSFLPDGSFKAPIFKIAMLFGSANQTTPQFEGNWLEKVIPRKR